MSDPRVVEACPAQDTGSELLLVSAPPSKTMYYRLAGLLLSGRGCVKNVPDCEDSDAVNDIILAAGGVVVSDGRVCLDYFRESDRYEVDVRCSGGALRVTLPALVAAVPLGAIIEAEMCERLYKRLEEGTLALFSQFGRVEFVKKSDERVAMIVRREKTPRFLRVESRWSSQPISGALIAATVVSALTGEEVGFELATSVSFGHVLETLEVIRGAGVSLDYEAMEVGGAWVLRGSLYARQRRYVLSVPGDWSLASLLLPLASRHVLVIRGLWKPWPGAGDHLVSFYARAIGYQSSVGEHGGSVEWIVGPGEAASQVVNVRDTPDLAVSLAYAGASIGASLRLDGVEHLVLKESNRLESITNSLRLCGANAYHTGDSMVVSGSCSSGFFELTCPNDHRIAMGATTLALASGSCIRVYGAHCVSKSWRGFWQVISELGVANLVVAASR